ncbi:accessory Sec system protein Asp2 [Aeromonas veronii]|uniref:accessory Sec system protein Asp2 n=1 Tax=Aeromonas veronii TaxID=654 RepID=UPI003D2030A8
MSQEQVFIKDGCNVFYKFQAAKQDRKHLLVVFSGFGAKRNIIYDFTGASSLGCRSNILWIKDDFYNECAFYLCHQMKFDIENTIISLINETISTLNIDKDNVTLIGFSKGGAASLYYGLKYDFKNIISSCPIVKVGSALNNIWPIVAKNVMGSISDDKISLLDHLIPDLLKNDVFLDRNIYLISSPRDEFYESEVEPFLHYFWKYKNFNFVFTDSCLAWRHNKVTRYNMPIILSIVYAHGEGVYPQFGFIQNGIPGYSDSKKKDILDSQKKTDQLISEVTALTFKDNRLFLNGCAFIKGVECHQHKDIEQTLILKSESEEIQFPLGSVRNEELSYKFFDTVFSDYNCGGVSTIKHQGIELSTLKAGLYQLYIMVEAGGKKLCSQLKSPYSLSISDLIGCDEISIVSYADNIYLSRRRLSDFCESDIFEINVSKVVGNTFFLEGLYAIKGIHLREWNDANFYLSLENADNRYVYKLGMLNNNNLNGSFQELYSIYQKSAFSTMNREGVNIAHINDGDYTVFISMAVNGSIYTKKCSFYLNAKKNEFIICHHE